jgi:DNA-binding protein WhiA
MNAPVALMKLENVRILKDMRNQVNRRVNCETANIQKTVVASVRQKEDIEFLMEQKVFTTLPQNLQEIAKLRLEYPDASLQKLGDMLNPPVGKSGVNHRLRKISNIAQDLRDSK